MNDFKGNTMKKLFLISLTSCFILLTAFAVQQAHAKQEIAFVDTVSILQESEMGKAATGRLTTLQENIVKNLEGLEAKRAEAEKNKDDVNLKRYGSDMQTYAYNMQSVIEQEQERIFTQVASKLTEIINLYRKNNELTAIFNKRDIVSSDDSADVTAKIMELFNKEKVDFGPLPNIDIQVAE